MTTAEQDRIAATIANMRRIMEATGDDDRELREAAKLEGRKAIARAEKFESDFVTRPRVPVSGGFAKPAAGATF